MIELVSDSDRTGTQRIRALPYFELRHLTDASLSGTAVVDDPYGSAVRRLQHDQLAGRREDEFSRLLGAVASGSGVPMSAERRVLVTEALAANDARRSESVADWAARLAASVANADD
jgi:hypothetical protein